MSSTIRQQKWISLFFMAVAVAEFVNGDCKFTRHMVENSNCIVTYRDSSGSLQLQRAESVPSGVGLYLYCTETEMVEAVCQENGQFSIELPHHCSQPMRTVVKAVKDNSCSAAMYAVGYVIDNTLLELYRSCFDARNVNVLYSESYVFHKSYFPKRPFVEFVTDNLFTPAQEGSYAKQRIFGAFESIFGQGQTYLPDRSALIINRGHLVASADFLFIDQMASTFRYINVVPQMKSINDGNWEKIERWVRDQIPRDNPFHVKTGGINSLSLEDDSGRDRVACLTDGCKIPVPEWTYKVVKTFDMKPLYVFVTFNSVFWKHRPAVPSFCQIVNCPLHLPDTKADGLTFCCNPENFPYL